MTDPAGGSEPISLLTVRLWRQSGQIVARVTTVADIAAPEERQELVRGAGTVQTYVVRWLAERCESLSGGRQ